MTASPKHLLLAAALLLPALGSSRPAHATQPAQANQPAQAKKNVYAELIDNMLSKCRASELEREESASAPCQRRIAKVDRLGVKVLPELLTALRDNATDGDEFSVDMLLDHISKHKTAQVMETLVNLMQQRETQENERIMSSLDRTLNELSGVKPPKDTNEDSTPESRKKLAQKWKAWWAKNRPAFALARPVLHTEL